jgi:hypothetical protein
MYVGGTRRKRIAELQAKAQRDVYGDLASISEPEYKDVVNTPNTWVVVFLFKPRYLPYTARVCVRASAARFGAWCRSHCGLDPPSTAFPRVS